MRAGRYQNGCRLSNRSFRQHKEIWDPSYQLVCCPTTNGNVMRVKVVNNQNQIHNVGWLQIDQEQTYYYEPWTTGYKARLFCYYPLSNDLFHVPDNNKSTACEWDTYPWHWCQWGDEEPFYTTCIYQGSLTKHKWFDMGTFLTGGEGSVEAYYGMTGTWTITRY